MSSSNMTTDHNRIRKWAEARNGHPARVRDERPGGILRIDFDQLGESLEEISWDEFFRIFDENRLAFLYQDKTDAGSASRFGKFVARR